MKTNHIIGLICLGAIWGSSFIFMRVLAPVLGPIATADFRVLLGGATLLIYYLVVGYNAEWKSNWRHYLVIGVLNSAIPFSLFSFAALHIPAGYSALLNSTAPLFGSVFSALWLGEALTARKLTGVVLGASGVALVARIGVANNIDEHFTISLVACLVAAMCYSLTGIYIKKFASGAKSLGIAGASQLFAGLALLPILPFAPIRGEISSLVVANMLALAILCSAIAYVLYFRLISEVGPTKALTVTFLIPVFGMIWGAIFLNEPITMSMLGGAGLIVMGIWFVVRK
ncbi:MAG: DMT family transporter [Candidatus Zixiibacteriota bacterium]